MKKGRDILILVLIISNFIGWIIFFKDRPNPKLEIRVVDIESIYIDFEMTKELEREYKLKTAPFNGQLDSLDYLLKRDFLDQKNINIQASIRKEIEDKARIVKQIQLEFEGQIWKRIEQYLIEFGDENKIDLIVNKGFNQEIFYSNKELNITERVTKYINNKYHGNETN